MTDDEKQDQQKPNEGDGCCNSNESPQRIPGGTVGAPTARPTDGDGAIDQGSPDPTPPVDFTKRGREPTVGAPTVPLDEVEGGAVKDEPSPASDTGPVEEEDNK